MTGDTLLSPVGNRVSQVCLACHAPNGKDGKDTDAVSAAV